MLDVDFPVGHAAGAPAGVVVVGNRRVAVEGANDVARRLGVGRCPVAGFDEEGLRHAAIAGDILRVLEPGDGGMWLSVAGLRLKRSLNTRVFRRRVSDKFIVCKVVVGS